MKTLLLASFALLATTASSLAKTGWDDDYEKSLAKAKEEKKMVLLDFTGSDWCGWCVKLDEEVFSKSAFKKFAKENLMLVELDFPHGKNLPKKTKEQNDTLKSKFGINGYPTIILLDNEGKEAARWVGYKATLLDELKEKAGKHKSDSK
ncbi:thioredoxin family protein [Prosthecobacter sp.]|uniref:thioredoxin family protein n=1 Tax=Prosthecobacter sp. TaxID=1965333 RepID=UPI002AB872DA|nr:thioredoxin family protein [Prosthecobacter sp.]MDZ4405625.1 thioredoxin family protein [Prosthecobacter sp.]